MSVLQSVLKLTLLDEVSGRARRIMGVLDGFNRQQTAFAAPLRGIMGQAIAFGGAYLGVREGMGRTVGAAIKFESAFADVRKVVDATDEQFQNMERSIKELSRQIPLTATDIAALYAAAGESGVATTDLKAFAEMAGRVGIAFDMSAGDAGESLAKLKTQLGLTVAETGDMADVINHLSNNMASKAKDITAYMLRVGALAEMGGFAKEEIAAIGSAMIAAGAEAEVAGTAMQNVVKALTRGSSAKKSQKDAAKALGLHLPTIAKDMQKDAKGTMKKVLTAIAKAPKDRHISLLSDFFGDEAKAFAPLVGNIQLLDQALGSVGDRTKYAGSAFKEYVARASTVENALQILGNKFAYVFEGMGKEWLPTIKEGVAGIGYVLDTLGERASIFDQMSASVQGFMNGLGYDSSVREMVEDLGDLLFGKVDGDGAADKIGRIFMQAKEWGASVRELSDAIRDNPIAQFFGEMAGHGFKLMLAAIGFSIAAGAIMKLARAIAFLTGITTAIGLLKTVGKIGGILGMGGLASAGGSAGAAAGAAGAAAAGAAARGGILPALIAAGKSSASFLARNPSLLALLTGYKALDSVPHDAMASAIKDDPELPARLQAEQNRFGGVAFEGGRHRVGLGAGPVEGSRPVALDANTISQIMQPSRGIQDVRVTNKEKPHVTVNASIVINGIASPEAAADAAISQMGQKVKDAVEAADTD
ncbi:phage tail tape measure protein [Shinella sp. NM-101]|uniref:phage tail tape measure protein n=1 Tax=Shinella sp. NM-101 TaxID=2744455 RepID=UPI001F2B116D|nr:phage tail tape measure protein [Shinella sp. NM-101]